MLDLYGGSSRDLPNLLNNSMEDLEAYLDCFIDDVQLGTGDAQDQAAWEREQREDNPEDGFHQHLAALRRILERARTAKLRFKLDKCYLCQWPLETLGMIAGCGRVKARTKKTQAINLWPRPSRLEDVERFLATTVFIREHLSQKYSHVSKPLRELLTKLQEDRRNGKKKGRAKFTPTGPAAPDHAWAPFWNQEAAHVFQSLK